MNNKICSILIPNRNSFEAVQLCIESIRKYTKYPNYGIIVYDDGSNNGIDLEYLKQARKKGWIEELIIGLDKPTFAHPDMGHGGALNILINEACQTSLAMVVDSDVYIKDYDWLSGLIYEIDFRKDLAVCDIIPKGMFTVQGYRMPSCDLSFGLINMEIYKDNMQVDWEPKRADRREEPFLSMFSDIYPPERSEFFRRKGDKKNFQENQVIIDVGSNLWMKANYDNPKGYKVIPIPENLHSKYEHFGHMSLLSRTDEFKDNIKFLNLKTALKELRSQ